MRFKKLTKMDLETWNTFLGYSWKILGALAAISGFVFYITSQRLENKKSRENATEGTISQPKDKDETDVKNTKKDEVDNSKGDKQKSLESSDSTLFVIIGSNRMKYSKTNFAKPSGIPIQVGNYPFPITVKQKDGNLLVDVKVYGFDGKTTAEIYENEWSVGPNNRYYRNYDKTGFEVKDEYGVIVLQVDYVKSNTIKINGVFFSGKYVSIIHDNGISSRPRPTLPGEYRALAASIKPIFKYPPKKENLGKRVSTN